MTDAHASTDGDASRFTSRGNGQKSAMYIGIGTLVFVLLVIAIVAVLRHA